MNGAEPTAQFAPASVADAVFPANDAASNALREIETSGPAPIVKVLTLDELLQYPFPEQELILSPWLTTQSLTMIHAWRGVGKTHVALNIAMAIASGGSFINWHAPKGRRVLYLDGEMPGSVMCARARGIMGKRPSSAIGDMLRFVTPDAQDGVMPDLATKTGQMAIESVARDAEVIIVDNISTLCRATGSENEAESWRTPQEWGLRMRRQGKSVVFVHHSGKGGGQRGSSKREDVLDVVIHLRRPERYAPDQGARFEIHFEKFRNIFGEDVLPIEVALAETDEGLTHWEWKPLKASLDDEVEALAKAGKTQREIAQHLKVSAATVNRAIARRRRSGESDFNPPDERTLKNPERAPLG